MREPASNESKTATDVAFGTSGVRGTVVALTDDVCAAYAAAFLDVMARTKRFDRVALGIDLRPSSPRMAAACAAAIRGAGYGVDFVGSLPTPALALYAAANGLPAIMVTGSHIPFDRNGLKFYRPDGEIDKAEEVAITAALAGRTAPSTIAELPAPSSAALETYRARYRDFFGAGSLTGLRLGLYEHSSVARDVLRAVLEDLGATVTSLGRTDSFVPIDTEAVADEDVERARAWSATHRFDAILSTDGDGDRPMIADEKGEWFRGDVVGVLTARFLGIRALAVPVSCNTLIEATGSFERIARTRIGSPYVIEAMAALAPAFASVAGFEANGGFLLGSTVARGDRSLVPLPTRDCALPMLAMLASSKSRGLPLSALRAELPARFTASNRIQNVPTAFSRELLEAWSLSIPEMTRACSLPAAEAVAIDRTDGLRVTFAGGDIVHLRPSGNAPELRCYAEASTQARADELVTTVLGALASIVARAAPAS